MPPPGLDGLRIKLASFTTNDIRVFAAFFLFGLINNVLYVVILSAALDLVGADMPKGVILLADVLPSFLLKLVAPYFIDRIGYTARVLAFCALSAIGMLVISLTPADQDAGSIAIKLVGVAFASLSSGGGELSFLALTHFYGQNSLAAWSSGTGGAGLVGAWLYVVATTTIQLSSSTTLLACAMFPVVMLASYFLLLPDPRTTKQLGYEAIEEDEDIDDGPSLLSSQTPTAEAGLRDAVSTRSNFERVKVLFMPYMLPLFLVYLAEYAINQGVATTLLFPLASTPFKSFRDFYPFYSGLYQAGVFISRSSIPFLRIHNLYFPSFLQIGNLVLLTLHALFNFIPNVYIIFVIIFWEGLLGGAVYVNTFAEISDNVPQEDREFSLAATTVSDSGGILIAALLGMIFEKGLCSWQVSHGRPYCRQTFEAPPQKSVALPL